MSVKKDGSMIVLSSPSGAGKTTLVKKQDKIAWAFFKKKLK